MGLPGQAQGISGRPRYTHTDVALNSTTRSAPSAARKASHTAGGIVPSCVGALENGSGVPQPRPPYWWSGAPFLGVLNLVGDQRSVRQRLFQQASAFSEVRSLRYPGLSYPAHKQEERTRGARR